jgi:hypothetical protein
MSAPTCFSLDAHLEDHTVIDEQRKVANDMIALCALDGSLTISLAAVDRNAGKIMALAPRVKRWFAGGVRTYGGSFGNCKWQSRTRRRPHRALFGFVMRAVGHERVRGGFCVDEAKWF